MHVVEVAEVALTPEQLTLFEGEEGTISAIARSAEGRILTGATVDWSSDDSAVALVSSSGVVRAEAPGETVVRAGVAGVEGAALVTVLGLPAIGVEPSRLELRSWPLSGVPATATVEVTNIGDGTLGELSASIRYLDDAQDWLSAEFESTNAPTRLEIAASARRLWRGIYRAEVEIESPDAPDRGEVVEVVLEVGFP